MKLILVSLLLINLTEGKRQSNIIIFFVEELDQLKNLIVENDEYQSFSDEIIPNIKSLVRDSVHFSNMHGESSTAATFAAMFMGKPAVDLGIIRGKLLPFDAFPSLASSGGLKVGEETLARKLKAAGYATWFTGFWKMGLGAEGNGFPTRHGFDSWVGVAQEPTEWCHSRLKTSNPTFHPYVNVFYKTTFLWFVVITGLTAAIWLQCLQPRIYLTFVGYTVFTSLAFCIVLHLFVMQRIASCVLFYHDEIYQQPYEITNLTLHFTQHTSRLIDVVASNPLPFFAVVNFVKISAPMFYSPQNTQIKLSSDIWKNVAAELDWSIGHIIGKLKQNNFYDDTTIILTGSKKCVSENRQDVLLTKFYERINNEMFIPKEVDSHTAWSCLKIPFYMKYGRRPVQHTMGDVISEQLSITGVHDTLLEIADVLPTKTPSLSFNGIYSNQCLQTMQRQTMKDKFPSNSSSDIDQEPSCHMVTLQDQFPVIYHYYNIHRPVMITYLGRYIVVYAKLVDNKLVMLNAPVIADLWRTPATNTSLEEIFTQIVYARRAHMQERNTERNPWSSQFEMPVYPWLLPCHNFPRCETSYAADAQDFSDVLDHVT